MAIVERPPRVNLKAVREAASIHSAGDTVENEVAFLVRCEQGFAIAGEGRYLKAEGIEGLLVGEYSVVVLLMLIFVQVAGIELVRTGICQTKCRDLAGIVRDLEV